MPPTSPSPKAAKPGHAWLAGLALVGTGALAVARAQESDRIAPAQELTAQADGGLQGLAFWKHVLPRVLEAISEDRVLSLAAGVVFYGLLALFPAITAVVSSYALFSDPATVGELLGALESVIPAGGYGIVQEQITRIASASTGNLSSAFLGGIVIALWSANAGLKAIIDALNIVYGVKEERSFIRLNAVSLAMTVCTVAGLLLAISTVVVLPVVLSYLPFAGAGAIIVSWLRWPALILLLMFALALLYRFGPNRQYARLQWFSAGSVFAAFGWLAGSLALSWYLGNFANYNATYGSLGAGIGLMMWLWVTAIVVLVGAEFNAVIAAARAQRDKPRGERIGGTKAV